MKSTSPFTLILLCFAVTLSSCSKSNNLLLGRVEEKVGSHIIIVTDCYKTTVPPPQLLKSESDKPFYRFTPCLDADVVIDGDQLTVNGTSYGAISRGDTVIVDHGKVLVNNRVESAVTTPN
jgi:hypothetical protein